MTGQFQALRLATTERGHRLAQLDVFQAHVDDGLQGADHLAVHSGTSDTPGLRMYAQAATRLLYQWWGEWSVWYLDGHTTVFGWRPVGTGGAPAFAALRLDPVALAFGPGVVKTPDTNLQQPLKQPESGADQLVEAFARPARLAPPGAAECLGWLALTRGAELRGQRRHRRATQGRRRQGRQALGR